MPTIHHIDDIVKVASKVGLTPLENAQNSSHLKYGNGGIKSKGKPFGKCPQIIISKIL